MQYVEMQQQKEAAGKKVEREKIAIAAMPELSLHLQCAIMRTATKRGTDGNGTLGAIRMKCKPVEKRRQDD